MVGIKGRSKACRTCLRRKKGCGHQRPSCEQCIRARIPCGGYPTELIFIEHAPKGRPERPNSVLSSSSASPSRLRAFRPSDLSSSSRSKGSISSQDSSLNFKHASGNIMSDRTLCQVQEESKICDTFWDMFLPNGRALPLDMIRDKMGGWINAVQDLHTTEPVLRKALFALSLTTIGKKQGSSVLVRRGKEYYGQALHDLSVALWSDQCRTRGNGLLAAIRLFGVYEVLHGMDAKQVPAEANRASWVAHTVGEFAFISAHEPSVFATHHLHQLFTDGRFYLAALALRGRVRTFLSTEKWLTEPWSIHKKTPRDLIIDILLFLPALFQDLDASASYPADTQDRIRAHLAQRCIAIQDRLLQWHKLYSARTPLAVCEDEVPKTVKAHDLAVAHLMSTYWATALMCSTLLDTLLTSLAQSPLLAIKLSPERRRAFDLDDLCRNIVNVVPVCLHPDAGIYRANLFGLQVSVVTLHLSLVPATHMMAERLWLAHNLNKPECSSISDFVWSLECHNGELYQPLRNGLDTRAIPIDVISMRKVPHKDLESLTMPEIPDLGAS